MTCRFPHAIRPPVLALLCLALPAAAQGDEPMADQAIGRTFQVLPGELPPPKPEQAVRNPAVVVPRGDARPVAPDGFAVELFAEGLENPRQMLVLDNGDVLLAQQKAGKVTLLRDSDGDGRAEFVEHFAQGFRLPYGLARPEGGPHAGDILVADVEGIWRVPFADGQVRATEIYDTAKAAEVPEAQRRPQQPMDHFPVTAQGVFGRGIGHVTRSLAIHPRTGALYVGVGSAGNIGEEPLPRASIQVFDADGGNQRTFASGMRNPIGLRFHPDTGALWAVVQERDGMGNRLVPDYLTHVQEGGFYGWPYAYIGDNPQPGFADRAPDKVAQAIVPDLLFEAHSSSMDFLFYTGEQFPEAWRGDAFVALKGSWNRADPTGYKVVRVPFEDGRPSGGYENFLTGFWVAGQDRAQVWGRPADVAQLPDGSLLVADDTGGTVWRVRHAGKDGG